MTTTGEYRTTSRKTQRPASRSIRSYRMRALSAWRNGRPRGPARAKSSTTAPPSSLPGRMAPTRSSPWIRSLILPTTKPRTRSAPNCVSLSM